LADGRRPHILKWFDGDAAPKIVAQQQSFLFVS